MRFVLAVLLLVLASCAGSPPGRELGALFGEDWRLDGIEAHPALAPGVGLSVWSRGAGRGRERVSCLHVDGEDVRVDDLPRLAAHGVPVDGPDAAVRFANLARRIGTPDLPGRGEPVEPDPSLGSTGGNGRYGRSDAAWWRVPFLPQARAHSGGWAVDHVVLVPPVPHPHLKSATPWRLVLRTEIVFPDGTMRFLEERTLSNGEDAERFARY